MKNALKAGERNEKWTKNIPMTSTEAIGEKKGERKAKNNSRDFFSLCDKVILGKREGKWGKQRIIASLVEKYSEISLADSFLTLRRTIWTTFLKISIFDLKNGYFKMFPPSFVLYNQHN